MEQNNSSTSTILLAAVGGAVLGAGLALLFAPQSGRRTRQKLSDLREDAEEYALEMLAKAEEGIHKAERKGEAWARKGEEFLEEKKRQVAVAMDGKKS